MFLKGTFAYGILSCLQAAPWSKVDKAKGSGKRKRSIFIFCRVFVSRGGRMCRRLFVQSSVAHFRRSSRRNLSFRRASTLSRPTIHGPRGRHRMPGHRRRRGVLRDRRRRRRHQSLSTVSVRRDVSFCR